MSDAEKRRRTRKLVTDCYETACKHGFHDERVSVEHMLMLVLSEIGEAVEADRKGRSRCDLGIFDDALRTRNFTQAFKDYVKDSLPDELADVCIRLYDMCGEMCLEPRVEYDTMETHFQEIFGEDSFCERMYYLSRLILETNGSPLDDGTDECLPQVIGSALSFLFALASDMGVDLMQHIELKMRYNEERPYLHGKKY